MKLDFKWIIDNWQILLLGFLVTRNFFNNLLTNCPFLKSNRSIELIQGIFNAVVQTVLQGKPKLKGEES